MTSRSTSIEIRDLEFARASGFVLGPISLQLAEGSRTALVGPSGCGKTSLLRCLAGLETPRAGSIRFGDRVVFDAETNVAPEERRIGFVFQDGALWPHKSALGQLRFAAPRLRRRDAKALLAQVGLAGKERRKPAALSGGERQRLALARALAGDPQILVLDEPLASVDVHLRNELALLVRSVAEARGLTLLIVTHDRDEALAMADDVVVLRDGELVEAGTARQLLRAPRTSFAASFLGRATCWPLTDAVEGRIATPFGSVPQNGSPGSALELVVLPGEARIAPLGAEPAGLEGSARGRVLRVLPTSGRVRALVEVEGRSLEVECDASLEPSVEAGAEVLVTLAGAPRLLHARSAGDSTTQSDPEDRS